MIARESEDDLRLVGGPELSVVVVEDDDVDAELLLRRLKRLGIDNIIRCTDGYEAVVHFTQSLDNGCLILLDLNLPRMDGFEVLEFLSGLADSQRFYVHVLSTSSRPDELSIVKSSCAAGFTNKRDLHSYPSILEGIIRGYAEHLRS